jgi:Fe-S cluster biogenesis protein NfuA
MAGVKRRDYMAEAAVAYVHMRAPARPGGLDPRLLRLQHLLDQVDSLADPVAHRCATEAIHALLQLHGDCLERVVDMASDNLPGPGLVDRMAGDPLISGLLLLHGLHPVTQEQRVQAALSRVRPYLASRGGGVELLSAQGGVVRLRLQCLPDAVPQALHAFRYAVEQAILEAAPDVTSIKMSGCGTPRRGHSTSLSSPVATS